MKQGLISDQKVEMSSNRKNEEKMKWHAFETIKKKIKKLHLRRRRVCLLFWSR